ncbi:MAG: hypothetical protein K2W78_16310 [Xanthobacteraceae bacterium]|nr:hypothetical protein [Xanthobacteraceae bacterium]
MLNATLPQTRSVGVASVSSRHSSFDRSVIRIAGTDKKTEPVVIDTSLPTIVPPTATVQASAPQAVNVGVREARAEVPKIEPVEAPKKKKFAHRKVRNPAVPVEQAPHVAGLFSGW